jgi:putative phosphoesterase
MRLIAVVADTHVPGRASAVPGTLLQNLEQHEPDKIFHAGDLTRESVLDDFALIAPTQVVKGNNDTDLGLPKTYAETVDGVRIAMRHRPGPVDLTAFAVQHDADIVVHGHTHASRIDQQDDLTVVNPGSPIVPRSGEPSYALISIQGSQAEVELETFTS